MELLVEIFYIVSIILVGLILRVVPHIRFYFPGTPDTFFFLNKIRNPDYMSEEVLYPKLFDQMLRMFVREGKFVDGRTTNRISIVLDIITASIIYLFVRSSFTIEIALLTTLLFLITPFIVRQGSTLSARSFGLLLASTSLLCITLAFPWNWVAIIPIAMTLLAHRLSSQTLFITFVGLSIMNLGWSFIFIAGFILAILVSKGEYIAILRAHMSAVARYYRQKGYPNERLVGIGFTPTFFGYFLYLSFYIAQSFVPTPIVIGGYAFPELLSINIQFELVMMIWGSACFALLLFWLAGESYKHLAIAATPFAFLTTMLAFTHQVFLIVTIVLIIGSLIQSLYFQLRFEHIQKDLVELLKHSSLVDGEGTMFAPKEVVRAVSFYTSYRVIQIYHDTWSKEHFDKRVKEEKPTIAVVEEKHRDWYSDWEEVESSGEWILFKT
ncbi:MAG: hypothetical protein ACFFBL_11655 [Promethearchaeota archaeon]